MPLPYYVLPRIDITQNWYFQGKIGLMVCVLALIACTFQKAYVLEQEGNLEILLETPFSKNGFSKVQRGQVTCPRSHSEPMLEPYGGNILLTSSPCT